MSSHPSQGRQLKRVNWGFSRVYWGCDSPRRSRSASRLCSRPSGRAAARRCRCASPETQDYGPCLEQTAYRINHHTRKEKKESLSHRWRRPSRTEPKWSSPSRRWAEPRCTPAGLRVKHRTHDTDGRFGWANGQNVGVWACAWVKTWTWGTTSCRKVTTLSM